MSPVRLGTGYKRPYKLSWVDTRTGKTHVKSFHWRGPRDKEAADRRKGTILTAQSKDVRCWDAGPEFEQSWKKTPNP